MLRPDLGEDATVWPGDDDPRGGHYAVLGDDGAPLAVGTVIPEAPGWRVRGMATAADARGRGLGAVVLAALIEHARAQGAELVWCAARPRAIPLYERAGFVAEGEQYDVPELGPHRRMVLSLG